MKYVPGLTIVMAMALAAEADQSMARQPASDVPDGSLVFKINYHVRPFEDTAAYRKLLSALNGFLRTKNENDTSNAYWLEDDFRNYKRPFGDLFRIEYSFRFRDPNFYRPTLLEIVPTPSTGQYIIKLAYSGPDTLTVGTFHAIYNIAVVRQQDGEFRFRSALGMNTARWHRTSIGKITYVYRDRLDTALARKMDAFSGDLARKFNIRPIPITYYKCRNAIELFNIKGFDYTTLMYLDTTGGRVEDNNTLFAANNSEWYPHEIVHIILYNAIDHPYSRIAGEGYATYVGGTGGESLDEALKITARFYEKHPERNVMDDLANDYRLGSMSVIYSIGGLICRLAEQRMGFEGIRQLFSDSDFYAVVEKVLMVKKKDFQEYVRSELMRY